MKAVLIKVVRAEREGRMDGYDEANKRFLRVKIINTKKNNIERKKNNIDDKKKSKRKQFTKY